MAKNVDSRKIKVDGKPVTVFRAGFIHGLQRSIRIAEAGEKLPEFYDKLDLTPAVIRYVHSLLYPSLISCSEGKLPSEERFIFLADPDAQNWVNTAQELNPDWFSVTGESDEVKDETQKKR